jgi:hypothetical protein
MLFRIGTRNTLELAYASLGSRAVQTRRLSVTLDHASADEACEAAFVGGPVALACSRFTEVVRTEVFAEYLASIRTTGMAKVTSFQTSSFW